MSLWQLSSFQPNDYAHWIITGCPHLPLQLPGGWAKDVHLQLTPFDGQWILWICGRSARVCSGMALMGYIYNIMCMYVKYIYIYMHGSTCYVVKLWNVVSWCPHTRNTHWFITCLYLQQLCPGSYPICEIYMNSGIQGTHGDTTLYHIRHAHSSPPRS